MTHKISHIIMGIFVMASVLMSCSDMPFFIAFQDIQQSSWDSNDTVRFSLPNTEHSVNGKLTVSVRTTTAFQYRDLQLLVLQRDSIGHTLSRDTARVHMLDNNTKGNGFPFVESSSTIFHPVTILPHSSTNISITHLAATSIDGIYAIGISLNEE